MTPEQVSLAHALRDELLLMFQDANALNRRAVVLMGIAEHYGLATIDGAALPAVGAAVLALSDAHDSYDEYCAALDAAPALKVAA